MDERKQPMLGAPGFDYNEILKQPLLPEEETCEVLGVHIAVTNARSVITYLTEHLEDCRGRYVCVSNVHTTVMAHDNASYLSVQNGALLVVPDGLPLVVVCRRKGFRSAMRVAGPDLMPALLTLSEQTGHKHYFYGSSDETLTRLREQLTKHFPNLQIAGMYSPPYKKLSELTREEVEADIRRINDTTPDFVWVGLGAPKQERWMAGMEGKINAVMLGVGAAFDFHAGTAKRAPVWVQKAGMEWFYRMLQDPKRLFRRYLSTNLRFIRLNLQECF